MINNIREHQVIKEFDNKYKIIIHCCGIPIDYIYVFYDLAYPTAEPEIVYQNQNSSLNNDLVGLSLLNLISRIIADKQKYYLSLINDLELKNELLAMNRPFVIINNNLIIELYPTLNLNLGDIGDQKNKHKIMNDKYKLLLGFITKYKEYILEFGLNYCSIFIIITTLSPVSFPSNSPSNSNRSNVGDNRNNTLATFPSNNSNGKESILGSAIVNLHLMDYPNTKPVVMLSSPLYYESATSAKPSSRELEYKYEVGMSPDTILNNINNVLLDQIVDFHSYLLHSASDNNTL